MESTAIKTLAAIIGTALLGVYIERLIRLRGEPRLVAIMGVTAMVLIFFGLS